MFILMNHFDHDFTWSQLFFSTFFFFTFKVSNGNLTGVLAVKDIIMSNHVEIVITVLQCDTPNTANMALQYNDWIVLWQLFSALQMVSLYPIPECPQTQHGVLPPQAPSCQAAPGPDIHIYYQPCTLSIPLSEDEMASFLCVVFCVSGKINAMLA